MKNYNDFILNRLIGGYSEKFLSFDDVFEALSLSNNPRVEEARGKIQDFLRAGEHNGRRSNKQLLSALTSPAYIQNRILRTNEVIRNLMEQNALDIITLLIHQELNALREEPTIPDDTPITLDDVICAAVESGEIKKASDWAAVLMLLNDMGHKMSPGDFVNKLRNNPVAARRELPYREMIDAVYVKHEESENYPKWPVGRCSGEKMERYKAIANHILPLVKRLSN